MSDSITIAVVPKNGVEEVRVSLSSFHGQALVDLRIFADMGDADERRPTKKGVSLKLTRLRELRAALALVDDEAVGRGLLDREGAR